MFEKVKHVRGYTRRAVGGPAQDSLDWILSIQRDLIQIAHVGDIFRFSGDLGKPLMGCGLQK